MNEAIIQKLHDFLLSEESIPVKDQAGIITPEGIDAKTRVQAIKDCLKIVEEGSKNE